MYCSWTDCIKYYNHWRRVFDLPVYSTFILFISSNSLLDRRQPAIDFNFYEALMGKGNTLVLLGKNNYLDALIAYNQASKIRPKDYQVWYNRGILLSQHLKRQGEAIESFDKAIQLRDNFHPAWLGKGIALTEIARYQPVLAAFDQAIKRQPQDPFMWANRGDTLTELKRYREARDSYPIHLG